MQTRSGWSRLPRQLVLLTDRDQGPYRIRPTSLGPRKRAVLRWWRRKKNGVPSQGGVRGDGHSDEAGDPARCPSFPFDMTGRRTVAVGFDGSANAKIALRWAVALCELTGATLRVIHVVGLLEERHLTTLAPEAADVALRIATEGGLELDCVEWEQLSGSPSEALLRATNPPNSVDLLVVGSRGSGRFPGTLLGSTSLEIAQCSSIPVTIVPNPD
jgi:nucleotide-binding universal stress UspA family protein